MDPTANPYHPPESNVEGAAPADGLVDAGKGRRFGTLVVDYVGYMILAFVVGVFLGLIFGEGWVAVFKAVPEIVFGCGVLFLYYVFFEGLWGRTPGKLVFGTRVVTETGEPLTFGRVALRTLCRFIPFEPFSFFGAKGWHDSLSKTRVVMAKK